MGLISSITGDGIIGGASSLGASIVGAISANKQIEKQYETQKALYQQQFEQQRQLIQEQNEYNSYSNQRKLMEEAGLNPALMYQNGTSGALQSEVANPQVPQAPLTQGAGSMIAGGIDKGIQTMMSLAQLKLLESQANKNNAETEGQNIINRYSPQQYEQQLRKGEVDIKYSLALTDKVLQDISESGSRIELNKTQVASLTQGISESQIRSKKYQLEALGIEATTELTKQKIATELLEQGMFAYREALMLAQTRETDAQTVSIKSKTFEQDWKNAFIQNTGFSPDQSQWSLITQECGNLSVQIGSLAEKGFNFVKGAFKRRVTDLQTSLTD